LSTQGKAFGTGLRTFWLKTIINCFLNAKTLSGFESLFNYETKKGLPQIGENHLLRHDLNVVGFSSDIPSLTE